MSWWPLCSDSATDPDIVTDKDDAVDFKEAKEGSQQGSLKMFLRERTRCWREGTVNLCLQQRSCG